MMSTQQVFLSYYRENFDEAKQLRKDLLNEGISVWWDQDVLPGTILELEILIAIDDCNAFLLCLSKEAVSQKKSDIYREADRAIKKYQEYRPGELYLIPVRFSDCKIPSIEIDSRRTLDRLQFVDLFPSENRHLGVQRLLGALRKALDIPVTPKEKVEIVIIIDRDFDVYTAKEQGRLLGAIREILKMDSVVIIIRKERGSVKLTIELSPARAEALSLAIKAGMFEGYGVVDARLQERYVSEDDLPPKKPVSVTTRPPISIQRPKKLIWQIPTAFGIVSILLGVLSFVKEIMPHEWAILVAWTAIAIFAFAWIAFVILNWQRVNGFLNKQLAWIDNFQVSRMTAIILVLNVVLLPLIYFTVSHGNPNIEIAFDRYPGSLYHHPKAPPYIQVESLPGNNSLRLSFTDVGAASFTYTADSTDSRRADASSGIYMTFHDSPIDWLATAKFDFPARLRLLVQTDKRTSGFV